MIRPSYVLGGRAMEIVHDDGLEDYSRHAATCRPTSHGFRTACPRSTRLGKNPLLIDSYLRDAIEVDVDAIADGKDVFICRHHGAYRGGGRAFRRLGLLAAAAFADADTLIATLKRADARARAGA